MGLCAITHSQLLCNIIKTAKMKKCYNCGIPLNELPKKERTKEHIPAKTFFSGYSEEYKNQRITVPACEKCNGDYSKIDDELRDVVGIINENDSDKMELTKNAVKKIMSNKKTRSEKVTFENSSMFVSFNANTLDSLHKKNFKGIYTKKTSVPLSEKYLIDVYSDGHDEKKLDLGFEFLTALQELGNWEVSGHSDVFKFKLAYFDTEQNELKEFDKTITEPTFLVSAMEYNNSIMAVVVALNDEKWKSES